MRGEPAILYIPAATNNRSVFDAATAPNLLKAEATTVANTLSNTTGINGADHRRDLSFDGQLIVESALHERKSVSRDESEELRSIDQSSVTVDLTSKRIAMPSGMDSTTFRSSLPYSSSSLRDVDSTLKRSRFEFDFQRRTTPLPLPPPVFIADISSEADRERIGDEELSTISNKNGNRSDDEQLPEMDAHSKKPEVAFFDSESSLRHLIQLKTPYFERGHLRTSLSWLYHPSCTQYNSNASSDFVVRISSGSSSSGGAGQQLCQIELPPQEFRVRFCVANLENLQFGCEYQVQVKELRSGEVSGPLDGPKINPK